MNFAGHLLACFQVESLVHFGVSSFAKDGQNQVAFFEHCELALAAHSAVLAEFFVSHAFEFLHVLNFLLV